MSASNGNGHRERLISIAAGPRRCGHCRGENSIYYDHYYAGYNCLHCGHIVYLLDRLPYLASLDFVSTRKKILGGVTDA